MSFSSDTFYQNLMAESLIEAQNKMYFKKIKVKNKHLLPISVEFHVTASVEKILHIQPKITGWKLH